MGKNTLLCLLLLASGLSFANTRPDTCLATSICECNAPPPDNFRVTQSGTHLLSVAWSPVSPGANYYLEVYESDGNDAWNLINVFNNISDSTKTVDGLTPNTKYRLKIYTQCSNGELGATYAILDHITLILELTLNGRQPVNPHPVDCHAIPFLIPENDWVGFRVSKGEEYSNYFEFVSIEESGSDMDALRRLQIDNPIVAADESGQYPTPINPELTINLSDFVNMGDIIPIEFHHIGYVDIVKYLGPNASVDLCPVLDDTWDPAYTFQAFVASETVPVIPSIISDSIGGKTGKRPDIAFPNPFSGNLEIGIHRDYRVLKIALWTPEGMLKMDLDFDQRENSILLPAMNLPAGAYLLTITLDDEPTNFRIIKM